MSLSCSNLNSSLNMNFCLCRNIRGKKKKSHQGYYQFSLLFVFILLVQLLFSLEVLIPSVLFGFDWAFFIFLFFLLLSLFSFCFLHSFIGGNEPSSGRNSPVPYRPDSRPLTPTYAQAPKHFHVPGRSWHCVCLAVLSQCRM